MKKIKEHFQEKGWFVLDFPDPKPVLQARFFLEAELAKLLGKKVLLEEYHHHIKTEEEHTALQIEVTKAFREQGFGPTILERQSSFFQELLGPDIFGQANPYLRITRPHKPQDNIGYHRDTFYGGSPYELSVFVPFVNLPKESSLSVLSGSHIHSEDKYPTTQVENTDADVRKGTPKHQLGFLYAPKVMDPSVDKRMEPIPLKIGQALIFCLSTVHGSQLNSGNISRWSSDMRIMSALAPVDLSARPDYYKPLCYSVVTQLLENEQPIELGRYNSYLTHCTPRRMLYSLSYYKFAAKMIGAKKRVLDVGCNEGLGSWVIAKECGFCKGVDFDQQAIEVAQKNFKDPSIEFSALDFFNMPSGSWDAAISFDVIEHIYPEHSLEFIGKIADHLTDEGVAVIGTPSKISQEFASPITKKGHVNIYSHERLYEEAAKSFEHVFIFAANDEVIHMGYLPLAHYFIALCCKPKR